MAEKEAEIRKTYKPTDEQYADLRQVYERYQQMGDKRSEQEKKWDRWQKQWEAYRKPRDSDDWNSDIYIPITGSIVEAMMSEIVNQDLMPYAVPRGVEDGPKATVMNSILGYTWDVSKSGPALHEIIHDGLVFGTGLGQEYYLRQSREIRNKKDEKHTVTEYDDCFLEPVSLWDLYVDEKARSFFGPFGARDAIRRYIMDIDDFKNFFKDKVWNPFNTARFVKPGGNTNYYEFYHPPEKLDQSKEVEVLWYWNKPEDKLAIVANDVLVRSGPNPYDHKQLPFVRTIDVKRNYQFYGKGEAELLESLQEETNTLRRMIIDRNHLDIDKPILVSDTLTIEDEDIIARPHGVIPVGDVNAAKPLEYHDIPQSVFKSLEMLVDDRIRITGLDERQQSVAAAGTATEAAILKEATLKRLNMKLNQIKNDLLVDIGRLRVANILQFYPQPKLEKIVGEKGTANYKSKVEMARSKGTLVSDKSGDYTAKYRNIRLQDKALVPDKQTRGMKEVPTHGFTFFEAKPDTFLPTYGGYDIRFKTTSSIPVSKPLKQQKDMEMYDRLIQNPAVDPWKLAEMLLETNEYDPEDYKMQQQGQQGPQGPDLQQLIDLAGEENAEMLVGKKIGATPYASPAHTEIHIEFMNSDRFQKDVPPERKDIIQNFVTHVMGEITAQEARGMMGQGGEGGEMPQGAPGGAPGQPGPAPAANAQGQNTQMAATMPGKAQGGGEMPRGMRGAETGIQVGRKI